MRFRTWDLGLGVQDLGLEVGTSEIFLGFGFGVVGSWFWDRGFGVGFRV